MTAPIRDLFAEADAAYDAENRDWFYWDCLR